MSDSAPPEEGRPHLVSDALRRRTWLLLLLTLVGALAGWLVVNTHDATYSASVRVLVRPLIGNPLAPDTGVSSQQVTTAMETEAQVVNSEPVAALSAPTLPQPWVPGSGTVKATVPANTQIVAVTFKADTAKAAQAGAQATAEAYLHHRSAVAEQTQSDRLKILTKQATTVQASLDRAAKAAAGSAHPEAAQQVQLYANQLVTIQNSITTLQTTGGNPGSLVAPAALPDGPDGLPPVLFVVVGALLGLLLAATLAIWLERGDTRLRATDTAVAAVPVVATMGSPRGRSSASSSGSDGGDSAQQFIERLRTVTLVAVPSPGVVAVAAVGTETVASPVAAELAQAIARAGYRVSLVVTDPSRSNHASGLDQADTGLAAALGTRASVHDYVIEVNGVHVLPAGRELDEQKPKLSSPRFLELLAELRSESDYVVLSAPPAGTAAGAAVAVAADSLILVGTDRTTSREDVEATLISVAQVDVRVIGIALVARGFAWRPAASQGNGHSDREPSSRPTAESAAEDTGAASRTPVQ